MTVPWGTPFIQDLTGKTIVVTGANSGLGYETARALAWKGARVVLACRDRAKGREAEARIRATCPDAATSLLPLDLASLADVRRFAARCSTCCSRPPGRGWSP